MQGRMLGTARACVTCGSGQKLMEETMAAAAKFAEKSMISTMVVKEAGKQVFEVARYA